MKYLLDTNACIDHLRRGLASSVSQRLRSAATGEICLCSVVRAELVYGAYRSNNPQDGLRRLESFVRELVSLPFDDAAADLCGEIRAYLNSRGTPIGPNDLMIASIALANHLTVLTTNIGEFARVPGLVCEDWSKP